MKSKYLTTLAAVSLLSLGMVTGCADPSGQTDVDSGEVNETDPGAEAEPGAEPGAEPEPEAGN